MPKHRPETPISQASSFSCEPPPPPPPPTQQQQQQQQQPSEPPFISGPQHPATPPEEEDSPALKLTEPPRTTPPSVSAFFTSINSFLESGYYHEQSLVLTHVSPSRLNRFQDWALKRGRRLRYTYDAPLRTLTIRGMITAVHGALNIWLSHVYAGFHAVLSAAELSNLDLASSFDVTLRGGVVRQPDAAFLPEEGEGGLRDPFPRVVFEAAFKQRYEEVVEVARIWLTKSGGRVKVVVVVNITEGPVLSGADEQDQEEEEESSGGDEAESGSEAAAAAESERFSSPTRFKEFHATCNIAEWVGPLTATIELFRLSDTEIVRDGPKYTVLPRTSQPDPVLRISDVVPGCAADDHRAVPLPLEPYRRALGKAVRDLALARKAAAHRGRKRARGEEVGINGEEFAIVGEEQEEEEEEKEGRDMKRVRVLRGGVGHAEK